MVIRFVAAVVAGGGLVSVEGGRLRCRLPKGEALPVDLAGAIAAEKAAIVAALSVAPLDATVRHILGLSDAERDAYRAALAHDLAACARAEAILAGDPPGAGA